MPKSKLKKCTCKKGLGPHRRCGKKAVGECEQEDDGTEYVVNTHSISILF